VDTYQKIEETVANRYGQTTTTRKAVGDFMLSSTHAVNVKSNNVDKQNYSPNIISIKKLHDWLFEKGNQLSLIFVDYREANGDFTILNETSLIPIETISWKCLTIEAQGYGVIQKNADLIINPAQNICDFYEGFVVAYKKFMDKERRKHEMFSSRFINDPRSHFGM
jgi:hypothetical protein